MKSPLYPFDRLLLLQILVLLPPEDLLRFEATSKELRKFVKANLRRLRRFRNRHAIVKFCSLDGQTLSSLHLRNLQNRSFREACYVFVHDDTAQITNLGGDQLVQDVQSALRNEQRLIYRISSSISRSKVLEVVLPVLWSSHEWTIVICRNIDAETFSTLTDIYRNFNPPLHRFCELKLCNRDFPKENDLKEFLKWINPEETDIYIDTVPFEISTLQNREGLQIEKDFLWDAYLLHLQGSDDLKDEFNYRTTPVYSTEVLNFMKNVKIKQHTFPMRSDLPEQL